MVADDASVPLRAVFPDALLRVEVDVENAEAFLITEAPFEVVHERPEIISGDVHAFVVQVGYGCEVLFNVVDA